MPNKIPILTYHSLNGSGNDYAENDHLALAADLDAIRACGYSIAPLPDLAKYLAGTGAEWLDDGKWVGLSFDDGVDWDYCDLDDDDLGYLKSFYTILRERFATKPWRGPLAVCFVIASPEVRSCLDRLCGAGMDNWRDTWWRAAAQSGLMAIGNHSWDHVHPGLPEYADWNEKSSSGGFDRVTSLAVADRQIADAERYIRERLQGDSAGLFAYPYGQSSDYLVAEYFPCYAESLGIAAAFSTGGDYATRDSSRWNIPRFVHGDHWRSPDELAGILGAGGRSVQIANSSPNQEESSSLSAADDAGRRVSQGDGTPAADDRIGRMIDGGALPLAPVVVHSGNSPAPDQAEQIPILPAFGAVLTEIAGNAIWVEQINDPETQVGELFRRHFQADPPSYGLHFVARCVAASSSSKLIGYAHAMTIDDMAFCGGMVINEEERRRLPYAYRCLTRGRQGVMEHLLKAIAARNSAMMAAIWSYVGDTIIEAAMLQAGFSHADHPHLMVIWNACLDGDERARRYERVAAMGPF